MSKITGLIFFIVLIIAVLQHPSFAQLPAQTPKGKWASVNIQRVREPLRMSIEQIATATGLSLAVAPELREQKAVVIIRDRPAYEVLTQIATVFGGEWVVDKTMPENTRYVLTQRKEVRKWANWYLKQRDQAEQYARQRQTDRAKQILTSIQQSATPSANDGTTAANTNITASTTQNGTAETEEVFTPDSVRKLNGYKKSIAKFLSFLSSGEVDQIAEFYGQHSPIYPVVDEWHYQNYLTPPIFVYPYNTLSKNQKDVLTDIYGKPVPDNIVTDSPTGRKISAGAPLIIGITLPLMDQLGINILTPSSTPLSDPNAGIFGYEDIAMSTIGVPLYRSDQMQQLVDKELKRRIIQKPLPMDALLGVNWTPRSVAPSPRPLLFKTKTSDWSAEDKAPGSVTPLFKSDHPAEEIVKLLAHFSEPNPYRRVSVLVEAANVSKKNIVSDYYSEPIDLLAGRARMIAQEIQSRQEPYPAFIQEQQAYTLNTSDPLTKMARRTGCVIRLNGDYLLCRKTDWPLWDRLEIPYPLVEQWTKEIKENSLLPLEGLAEMSQMYPLLVDNLSGYDDGTISFQSIASLVRGRHPDHCRFIYSVVASLPDVLRREAMKPEGIPCSKLPIALQRELRDRDEFVRAGAMPALKMVIFSPAKLVNATTVDNAVGEIKKETTVYATVQYRITGKNSPAGIELMTVPMRQITANPPK